MLCKFLLLFIVLSAVPMDSLTCRRSANKAVCYTRSKLEIGYHSPFVYQFRRHYVHRKISYNGALSNCVKVCKANNIRRKKQSCRKLCEMCRKKCAHITQQSTVLPTKEITIMTTTAKKVQDVSSTTSTATEATAETTTPTETTALGTTTESPTLTTSTMSSSISSSTATETTITTLTTTTTTTSSSTTSLATTTNTTLSTTTTTATSPATTTTTTTTAPTTSTATTTVTTTTNTPITTPSLMDCFNAHLECGGWLICGEDSTTKFCNECREKLGSCRKYLERRTPATTTVMSTTRRKWHGKMPDKDCSRLWIDYEWYCQKSTTRFCEKLADELKFKWCHNYKRYYQYELRKTNF